MPLTTLREWLTRLLAMARPGRSDADLEQELRLHAEMAADAAAARGGAADRQAMRAPAPSVAHAMDALRDQRGVPWLDDLWRDVAYGLRVLNRQRLFAAVAVLTRKSSSFVNRT